MLKSQGKRYTLLELGIFRFTLILCDNVIIFCKVEVSFLELITETEVLYHNFHHMKDLRTFLECFASEPSVFKPKKTLRNFHKKG